jgi:short-subunit dehydrogenase
MSGTVLITGITGGFGFEFAKLFAQNGYNIVGVARNPQRLLTLCTNLEAKYGIQTDFFACDFNDPDAVEDLFGYTESEGIQIDILVNNAGFGDHGPFSQSNLNKQVKMIDVNVVALTKLTYYYLKGMLERKNGKILNVASIASFMPGPDMSVYYATKAYVLSLSEALHEELEGTGVTVTALCPGPTNTGFASAADIRSGRLADVFRYGNPYKVARKGYQALMKSKAVEVPGIMNKAGVAAAKLLPRPVVRKAVKKFQG